VIGVEALKDFSGPFLSPYELTTSRDSIEELERKISTLKQQLNDVETELDRIKKGKQKA
uniref:Uncharacterized protein n=1 Tax=Cucumis melo TaxID=3656 RepID=A0A9I9CCI0_CUCME